MADCIRKLGCPASKVMVHRIGIDLDRIPSVERVVKRGERLRFLIIGAFRQKKGIPLALQALGRLKKDFDHFDITIIGDAIQPDEVEEKRKIVNTLGEMDLMSRTRMLGFQSYENTLRSLYDHHVLISPSITADDGDTEGGAPVTILEAAASGMPVISTRHCDIPNVLGRPNVELLADENDVTGLVKSIKRLLDMQWHGLVVQNRRFIEKHHHPYTLSSQLENLYHSL
jgi:colanic acid/amylovoran biosynthesis glycosyltransferase